MVGAAGLVALFFLLGFLGIIPIFRPPLPPSVEIVFWGVGDEPQAWESIVSKYHSTYPEAEVKYVQFDEEVYEDRLIDALAAGQGPDIFMFHNTWLPKHGNKIVPASPQHITFASVRELFPQVVEQDFVSGEQVYSLPMYVDTLALIYNRDIFDAKGIAVPPKTWDEFKTAVLKTRGLTAGRLSRSGASIGGTTASVKNAPDILALLMMQYGAQMVSADFSHATFSTNEAADAVKFYAQFANPKSPYYTWSDSFKESRESFADEQVAMLLGYATDIPDITAINPSVKYGIKPVPQVAGTDRPVNFANYWGLAVSAWTPHRDRAWDFVVMATTEDENARKYVTATGKPPALRFLKEEYEDNIKLGVFVNQTLTARSWAQADRAATRDIFDAMIKSVVTGQLSIDQALRQAAEAVSLLMRKR